MKIISDFKDYYDIGLQYGVDPLINYNRFTKEYDLNQKELSEVQVEIPDHYYVQYPILPKKDTDFTDFGYERFYVFFCGQVVIGYKLYRRDNNNLLNYYDTYYSLESIIKFLKNIKLKRKWQKKEINSEKFMTSEFNNAYSLLKNSKYNDSWHIKFNSPVFLISSETVYPYKDIIIINPKLDKYKFQKVKDPVTAFQEISQYLSNIFGYPGNEMIEVSDKTKISKHGFNKWSFRKMKED